MAALAVAAPSMAHSSTQPAEIHDVASASRHSRRVAIGKFDGVHAGHEHLLEGCDSVITFDRHPLTLLRPQLAPKALTTLPQRAGLVGRLGVKQMIVLGFDHRLADLRAREFVTHFLVERLAVKEVTVGENFRFGHRMEGDAALLATYENFTTHVVPLLEIGGQPVSSSRIRRHLTAGETEAAARLLGRPYAVRAHVHDGPGPRRRPGGSVPALLEDDVLLPPPGVYQCRVEPVTGSGPVDAATVAVAADATPEPGAPLLHISPPPRVAAGAGVEIHFLRADA